MEVRNPELLPEAAMALLKCFPHRRVFAFYGSMGAGKTTFIKSLCETLGSFDDFSSPTYGLVNEYNAGNKRIYHMDLYRLNDVEEALQIGMEDYLADANGYCFIEWPQLIETLLPDDVVKVHIEVGDQGERVVKAN